MEKPDPQQLAEILKSLVKNDDLRVTKSRNNVNGIYVDARAADMLECYGVTASFVPVAVRNRIHDDFDFGSYSYSVDTRIANQLNAEPGEKGWNLDALDGAQHLDLSAKGAQKHKALGGASTINPTPVDASADHVRMAMGPGGAIY